MDILKRCETCKNEELCDEWAMAHEQGMGSNILETYQKDGDDCEHYIRIGQ